MSGWPLHSFNPKIWETGSSHPDFYVVFPFSDIALTRPVPLNISTHAPHLPHTYSTLKHTVTSVEDAMGCGWLATPICQSKSAGNTSQPISSFVLMRPSLGVFFSFLFSPLYYQTWGWSLQSEWLGLLSLYVEYLAVLHPVNQYDYISTLLHP